MVNEEQRNLIWKAVVESDYMVRYWGMVSARFDRWERALGFVVALSSSAAFLAVLAKFEGIPLVELFTAAAAAAGVGVATSKLSERGKTAAVICRRWIEAKRDLESLWSELENIEAEEAMRQRSEILHRQNDLLEAAVRIPVNNALRAKAEEEVWNAAG